MIELDLWVLAGLIELALLALIGFARSEGARRQLSRALEEAEHDRSEGHGPRAEADLAAPAQPSADHAHNPPSAAQASEQSPAPLTPIMRSSPPPPTPIIRSAPPPPPPPSVPPPPPAPPPEPEPVLLDAKDAVALLESHVFGPSADELAMLEDVVESAVQKLAREHSSLKKTVTSLEALVSSHSTLSAAACALIEADGATEPQIAELNRIATGLTEAEHTLSDATSEAQDTGDSLNALLRALQPYTKEGGYTWSQAPGPPHLVINRKILERAALTSSDAQASLRKELKESSPAAPGAEALSPGDFVREDDAPPP